MATRLPRRINLLWVLAALLGTAAVHGTYRAVHYPEPSAGIMEHFAGVTAGFAASIAEARLQALAREAFAPVRPWSPGPLAPPAVLGALARGAREAERCRCRRSIPVVEFFHFDLTKRTVDLRTRGADAKRGSLPDSLLLVGLFPAPADGPESLDLDFVADGSGDQYAILAALQFDSGGSPATGYGLVTHGPALAEHLFAPDSLSGVLSSLEVATASGPPLYHTPGPDAPFHATIRPPGLLSGLAITSRLELPRGMLGAIGSASRQQLWLSGVLLVSTVLVIVIAAVSSRREALLARARSDFIAGVSHELRMPLAQILLASETLAEEREPDSAARLGLATSIVREARRLATMVDNVLLVARSGAVTLRPTLGTVYVDELFTEVQESVQLAVEDAGQLLEVRRPPWIAVHGDRQLLRQALTNLIDNACKYGSAGRTIRLGAETAGAEVHVYVANDGPGIPHSERAKVFEPYERLARDQTSERTGSGLGLAVVAQIARACGGRVWLEDGRPSGTRAVLALRVVPPPQIT